MFSKLSNSWDLAKESFNVLKQDKELMVFPVLSFVMTVLLLISFFVPAFTMMDKLHITGDGPVGYILLFMVYFIGYFVVLFCNTALLHCAKMRFEGGDPTVGDGMRAGFQNLGRIVTWAAIGGTIGVVLAQIEERLGFIGRIIRGIVGGAWVVITYFAVPVMIFEQTAPMEAIKRSKDIIYKTWGEAAAATIGMRYAQGVVNSGGILILIASTILAVRMDVWNLFYAGLAVSLTIWIGGAIVFSCLTQIYRAALYIYATTNEPPRSFRREYLETAFG